MLHDGNKSLEQDTKGKTSEGANSTSILLFPGRSNSKGIDFVTSSDFGNYQPSILSHTGMRRSPIAGRRSNLNLNMGESSLVPKANGGTTDENMASNNNNNNDSLNHLCEFLPLKDKEGVHENMKEKSFSNTIGPTYKTPFTPTTNMNNPKGPKVPTVKALIGKFSHYPN